MELGSLLKTRRKPLCRKKPAARHMQLCTCRARVPVGASGAKPVCSPFTARCSGWASNKKKKAYCFKTEEKGKIEAEGLTAEIPSSHLESVF